MDARSSQRLLGQEQLREFAHDGFVDRQVQDFADICLVRSGLVTDVGGGCGIFASALVRQFPDVHLRVIDCDCDAVASCQAAGIEAEQADLLSYFPSLGQHVACFNLVLHHLVGSTDAKTRRLQLTALRNWNRCGAIVFVNEYVYDSWMGDAASRLVYAITSSQRLARLGNWIAARVPSLRANTFGTGVRFRSRDGWMRLFRQAGFEVASSTRGEEEKIRRPLGLLFRSIRRDSFVLKRSLGRIGR